ncbi:protein-glutamine gamma-glutamyltransferase E-like [Leptodactylus fuscus]
MAEKMILSCKSPCLHEELAGEFKVLSAREIGKDVVLNLSMTNLTTDPKLVNVDIRACAVLYTKKEINELLKDNKKICVEACEGAEIPVVITYAMYDNLLTADNSIEVTAVCTCESYDGLLIIEKNVVLDNPKFEIKLKKKAIVNKPTEVDIVFTNPLNKVLSNIVVTAEGSGLLKNPITAKADSVKPNETITITLSLQPYKSGTKQLLVDFSTSGFQNSKGYQEMEACFIDCLPDAISFMKVTYRYVTDNLSAAFALQLWSFANREKGKNVQMTDTILVSSVPWDPITRIIFLFSSSCDEANYPDADMKRALGKKNEKSDHRQVETQVVLFLEAFGGGTMKLVTGVQQEDATIS